MESVQFEHKVEMIRDADSSVLLLSHFTLGQTYMPYLVQNIFMSFILEYQMVQKAGVPLLKLFGRIKELLQNRVVVHWCT